MSFIECDTFFTLEPDEISDFLSCYQDLMDDVESICNQMNAGLAPDGINDLFRSMHSLKGNCRMVLLNAFVDVFHRLEELVSDIRERRYPYDPSIGEYINTTVWHIQRLLSQLVHERKLESTSLSAVDADIVAFTNTKRQSAKKTILSNEKTAADLRFFRSLALKLDERLDLGRGPIDQMLTLCLSINTFLKQSVDPQQLSAAVYIHDLGMAHLPGKFLQKSYRTMNNEDMEKFINHIYTGNTLLERNPFWQEAARITQDHHEHYDGTGLPGQHRSDGIHLGAQIILIANDYLQLLPSTNKSNIKTVVHAIKVICDYEGSRYHPDIVRAFKSAIHNKLSYQSVPNQGTASA